MVGWKVRKYSSVNDRGLGTWLVWQEVIPRGSLDIWEHREALSGLPQVSPKGAEELSMVWALVRDRRASRIRMRYFISWILLWL
jgi:hypothetical protein